MTGATAAIMNLVASALAAVATAVLAVFAERQWRVMKENNEAAEKQNELVRDRWKREDELRAEETKPKAAFGFSDSVVPCDLKLSCANLGTVGFLVAGMQVIPLLGDPEKILFGKGAEIFVPVGEEKQVAFDSYNYREMCMRLEEIFNGSRVRNLGIKLILQGPMRRVETNMEAYRLSKNPDDGRTSYIVTSWRTMPPPAQGSDITVKIDKPTKVESVTCPKCNNPCTVDLVTNLGIVFPVEDCGTVFEAARKKMARYLAQSCPTHTLSKIVE